MTSETTHISPNPDFSPELLKEAQEKSEHVIVTIGVLGNVKCYLDWEYDAIVADFNADDNYHGTVDTNDVFILPLAKNNTFNAYEIRS